MPATPTTKDRLDRARRALRLAVDQDHDHESLASHLERLATLEGRHFAEQVVHEMSRRPGVQGIDIVTYLIGLGPNDTYSGRTNDTKRAWYDGVMEVAIAYGREARS